MQNRPGAQLIVAADGPQLLRHGAVVFKNPPVNRRTKPDRAGADMLYGEEVRYQFRATDMTQVAVGQEQGRQTVDALGAEERLGEEFDTIGRTAIHQEIVMPARRVEEDRHARSEEDTSE